MMNLKRAKLYGPVAWSDIIVKRILDFDEIVTQYMYSVEEIVFAIQWSQHFSDIFFCFSFEFLAERKERRGRTSHSKQRAFDAVNPQNERS